MEVTTAAAKAEYLASRQTRADWTRYVTRVEAIRSEQRDRAARVAALRVYRLADNQGDT